MKKSVTTASKYSRTSGIQPPVNFEVSIYKESSTSSREEEVTKYASSRSPGLIFNVGGDNFGGLYMVVTRGLSVGKTGPEKGYK